MYTKEKLFSIIREYEETYGRLPSQNELRKYGYSEDPFVRVFGGWKDAKKAYLEYGNDYSEYEPQPKCSSTDALLEKLKDTLSPEEIKMLVASATGRANKPRFTPETTTETGHFKFIATGDSHIGHSKFREDWWESMISRGIKENVDFMYHTGDVLEGMSGRPGHVYELEHIGFERQFAKAKELLSDVPFSIKMINGNHDLWFAGKADQGINVGKRLSESLDNVIFLGNDEADDIVNGVKVKLWHGNDGSTYALSYRTQKFVEMLYGGEKPNILLAGHAHKSIFYETRNVHVFETGTTCMQSSFMRGKKLAAHTGYWIVEVWTNDEGITRLRPEWNPFYY